MSVIESDSSYSYHLPDTSLPDTRFRVVSVLYRAGKKQSCYQGLSLRGQGQDILLKAKDIKNFQGQGDMHYLYLLLHIVVFFFIFLEGEVSVSF